MTYSSTDSSLAQLIIKHKMLCAAQCAYEYPDCNTAVYDSSVVPQCLLFSAPLTQLQLALQRLRRRQLQQHPQPQPQQQLRQLQHQQHQLLQQ
ncbi:unnamed protein product, partial [Adineta steineri]